MKKYQDYLETIGEYGETIAVKQSLVYLSGLPNVKAKEIVMSQTGKIGEVLRIDQREVVVAMFNKEPVFLGEQFVRTDSFASMPVGLGLLGKAIDPLGLPLGFPPGSYTPLKTTEERLVDQDILGISKRVSVNKPLLTGVLVVDLTTPLGKGQKELVVGDRKSGKTSFLLTVAKNQINQGAVVVYAAVGKRKSEIKKLLDFFTKENLRQRLVFIASSSFDSSGLICITPNSAITLAEYFRDQGEDVLLIIDDLTTHAKYYREISLLSGNFPGRESYPGDIFYTHAKLMERAGNFIHPTKKEVSITCLPIVETVESDLTGYITTNVMSMTDGHIFFDSDVFTKGRRPAVNIGLSVTRVGKQAQTPLKRAINQEIFTFLTEFERAQTYSHFGAELSGKTKQLLEMGDKILTLFQQPGPALIPELAQLILFGLVWSNSVDKNNIEPLKVRFSEAIKNKENEQLFATISNATTLYQFLTNISNNKQKLLSL